MARFKGHIKTHYRGVVLLFALLTLFLIGLIVYFSFSKTVITVLPAMRETESTLSWQIGDLGEEVSGSENFLSGKILSKELTDGETFSDLGETSQVPAQARGTVTIVNNYSKTQPLVATTRLLSREGVLFRTQKTVQVAPGQKVDVAVIADQPGATGNIGPSHFTIVALWQGLQDKIYGDSSAAMTGGLKDIAVVTSTDIAEAEATVTDHLFARALQELQLEAATENPDWLVKEDIAVQEVVAVSSDVEPNKEVDLFRSTATVRVQALAFDQEKLWELAGEKLKGQLSSGDELLKIDRSLSNFTISDINSSSQISTIKMNAVGLVVLRLSSPILDRKNFTNKDRQDIRAYLLDFEEISDAQVRFSPFWTFRAPALEDHIEVRIQKSE